MNEKIIIDYISQLDVKTLLIVGFIILRLFPEVRQYIPDIWEVVCGRKKFSDIRVKSGELKHFEKKQTFLAAERISEVDCDAFYLRLMRQINQAANSGESITFSFVKVRKISNAGIKGIKKMIDAISIRDDCVVKIIFPRCQETEVLKEVHEYALNRIKSGMMEIREDKRTTNHDTEE